MDKKIYWIGLAVSTILAGYPARVLASAIPAVVQDASAKDSPQLKGPLQINLTMTQAMDETLMQSPRASSLRLQLGIAKSSLVKATEMPNPSLFMDNGYRAEFTYRYGVSAPIELPWKLALRIMAAKKQIGLADLQISKGLWSLRGDIRRSYTEALMAQERYQMADELTRLFARLKAISQVRFDNGDVAELDVQRADLALERAEIRKDALFGKIARAKQGLAVLLGRNYLAEGSFEIPRLPIYGLKSQTLEFLPDIETPVPDLQNLLQKAMANRLEIKIVEQSKKLNSANLKLAYGNVLPNPTIAAGTSAVNGPPLEAAGPTRNTFRGFFFQTYVPVPIFNFNQGDISQYRARSTQINKELDAQKNIVQQEVVMAHKALQIEKQRIQALQQKTMERSKKVAQMAQKSYEIGQFDMAAVLLAQQENLDVQNEYLDAVYAYEMAYTDLEQSIGTLLY
ncbi:MAG: TolC family protein [Candidatus Obscuribacterales bacterium]|jgi:outer membrane protein TolC|nr:TolC family protein [Candidatus Obscuribacterales bacterium]